MRRLGLIFITLNLAALTSGSLFDHIQIDDSKDDTKEVRVGNSSADFVLQLGVDQVNELASRKKSKLSKDCSTSQEICRNYTYATHLTIRPWKDECVLLNYSTAGPLLLEASIDLKDIFMYGGPLTHYNSPNFRWPTGDSVIPEQPWFLIDTTWDQNYYYGISEPYWLFSNGYYIYVNQYDFLHCKIDDGKFLLRTPSTRSQINLALCKLDDAREAHKHAIKHFLGKPSAIPDIKQVLQPVWTTSSRNKLHSSINQTAIMDFAEKISENGYGGKLVIGYRWEKNLGSLEPDSLKFPNFTTLMDNLRNLNFSLAMYIHSFLQTIEKPPEPVGSYLEPAEFRNDSKVCRKLHRSCSGAYINLSIPDAQEWFKKRILNLRQLYGIDSFEFENGDQIDAWSSSEATALATAIKQNFKLLASLDSNIVINVARGTQNYGFFVAMPQVIENFLIFHPKYIIPHLLHMNILGYSFVMPNIIGGDLYLDKKNRLISQQDKEEYYIRWVQTSVFMPSMQFSIHQPPWIYRKEIADLTKMFVDLHANYSAYIIELMKENVETGAPVNPPIWWIAPNDSIALRCSTRSFERYDQKNYGNSTKLVCRSEFLLGDKILVAPVLELGQRQRDIYLPVGHWKDGNSEKTYNGPTWVKDYPAGLNILPYFLRLRTHV